MIRALALTATIALSACASSPAFDEYQHLSAQCWRGDQEACVEKPYALQRGREELGAQIRESSDQMSNDLGNAVVGGAIGYLAVQPRYYQQPAATGYYIQPQHTTCYRAGEYLNCDTQ